MPNNKSAKKRMRTSELDHQANSSAKSRLSSTRRKLTEAIAGRNKEGCDALFRQYCSHLDKAVKRGAVKANNASRNKSRAAASIAAI
jgi:small subunit ribosomal protein S20